MIILVLALILFGLGAISGFRSYVQASDQVNWPVVNADVVEAKFDVQRTTDLGKIYKVDVKYKYVVNGHVYESASVSDRDNFTVTEATLLSAFGGHSPKSVKVHYNPKDASESYIYLTRPVQALGLIAMCVVLSIISIFIFIRTQ